VEIKQGTSFKVPVKLRNATTGAGTTGKAYTDVTVYLQKQGGSSTTKTLTLAAQFVQVDATNFAGVYDLLLSTTDTNTPGFLKYSVACSGCETYHGIVEIAAVDAAQVYDAVESHRGHHTSTGSWIYVAPVNGNDSTGDGSRAAPFKTVTAALAAATAGAHQTIYVLADQASGVTTLTESITWNKRYTFLRGPGRDLIIKGASANTPTITVTANGAEFSGFQLDSHASGSNADGIEATAADFTLVRDVWINATQGTGIELINCSNAQIERCDFQGTGLGGSSHGLIIAASAGGNSRYNEVRDNIFADVQGDAIRLTKTGGGSHENTVVRRNSIHGSTGWGINVGNSVVDSQVTDNRLGSNASGDITDSGTTTTLLNNEQWAKNSSAFTGGAVASVTGDVGGKVLGGGAGTITGTGVRAVDSAGAAIAPAATALTNATWTDGRAAALDNLDTNVGSRLAAASYTAPPSAAANADAVWDEATVDHQGAGSTGLALTSGSAPTAAQVADAVWDEATADHQGAGSTGLALTTIPTAAAPTAAAVADAVWDEALADHLGVGSTGEKLNTPSVDTAAIADAVWDEAALDHQAVGSTGLALTSAGSSGPGVGSELLTVTVLDNLAAPIQGAEVFAHNAAGALVGTAVTDASGEAVVMPGPGVITLTATFAGFTFAAVEVTVAPNVNQTGQLDGVVNSIPVGSSPDRCAVYAQLEGPDGTAASGVAGTAHLKTVPQKLADVFVAGTELAATSDGSGMISWDLPRGAKVLVHVPGYIPTRRITVPDATSYAL
jgi:hypothetical protein